MDINDWLECDWLESDAVGLPCRVRRAVAERMDGKLREAWGHADGQAQSWAVCAVSRHYDTVLDMLTEMVMDGVYGRNQEERIATHLTIAEFADARVQGLTPAEAYYVLDVLLSTMRTDVRVEDVMLNNPERQSKGVNEKDREEFGR